MVLVEESVFSGYLVSRLADYKESCESGHPKRRTICLPFHTIQGKFENATTTGDFVFVFE